MKQIIVFDVDGTLFDTKKGICKAFNYVLKKFSCPIIQEQEIQNYIGPSVTEIFTNKFGMDKENAIQATHLYRKIYVEKYIDYSILYSGVVSLLNHLKVNNYKMCIATNKTKKQVDKLLSMNDFNKYFDIVFYAKDDGSLSKKDMLCEIKTKYGVKDVNYYMVGDTLGDYQAAINNGYVFIGANYGYGQLDMIENSYIVEKASDIFDVVEKIK